jgi:hypothetical protein
MQVALNWELAAVARSPLGMQWPARLHAHGGPKRGKGQVGIDSWVNSPPRGDCQLFECYAQVDLDAKGGGHRDTRLEPRECK